MCKLVDNKQLLQYTETMYLSDGQHSYLQTTKCFYFAHQWWQPVPLIPLPLLKWLWSTTLCVLLRIFKMWLQ
jgi:hypothetical protein